jgi:hypothetical protein
MLYPAFCVLLTFGPEIVDDLDLGRVMAGLPCRVSSAAFDRRRKFEIEEL